MGVNLQSDGLSGSDYITFNGLKTYFKTIYVRGSTTYTFDIDVKTTNGTGAVYEIFAGYTHYGATYAAVLKQVIAHRSNIQSDVVVLDTSINITGGAGSWSVSYVDGDTIRLTKAASSYATYGYGYILVRGAE